MADIFWEELGGTLFEEAGDALFLFDPESEQISQVNPMAQRLSGFTSRELLAMHITQLIRSDIEGGLQRMRLAFRRTGIFHSQEGFWLRNKKDGLWIPVNLTITRLHTEPKVFGLITARDISERREAHVRLQESEERYRTLFETSIQGIVVHQEGIIRFGNEALARMFGYDSPAELIGKDVWKTLVVPHEWPALQERTAACLRGEKLSVHPGYQGIRKDGSLIWVQATGSRILWEGKPATCGFLSDVTESRRSEEAVRSSEAKYRTLIENLSQSVFLKDKELRFVAANEPFCRSFGRTAPELIGRDDYFLFPRHLADKYRADDRRVLEERRRLEIEEQTLMHGKTRTVQVVKTPVLDAQGRPIGVLGIFWDVTDQRNVEAQLRQAHKMEAVGQLAGGIAHDFNNLLTGILGNLSLALSDLPEVHPCRDLLVNAEGAALRAAELTRQLLGFSRRTPLAQKVVSLNTVIEETIRLLQRTFDPRITIEVACAPDLWSIQADSGSMGQVLMNLCLNARDAMPRGGKLVIQTANRRLDHEAANRTTEGRPGDYAQLQVRDTGAGMMPDVRDRIFEPFFTTKEPGKGTGLGLAMVFGIVKAHGGWIECQSEPARGTTFDVYFPAITSASTAPANTASTDGVRGGHETILLADDEQVVGRLGETILKRHGYQVLVAANGTEALRIFRERHQEIDLVILDLSMPELSGAETLCELRKIDPAAHVLISSGYSSDEDVRSVEGEGVLGFVGKPYRPAELARQVRAVLDKIQGEKVQGAPHGERGRT
jgi:PAS domain S-box-containing protein